MSDDTSGYKDVVTGARDGPSGDGAAAVQSASTPELRSLTGVVVAVVAVAALYFGKEVLIPITLAVLLSFVLSPIVNRLHRWHVWRAPAVMIAVVLALGVLGLLGTLIGSQVASLAADAPKYAQTIEGKVQGLQGGATAKLQALTKQFGGGRSHASPPPPQGEGGGQLSQAPGGQAAQTGQGQSAQGQRRPVPVQVVNSESSPFTVARTILAPILSPLETFFIVLVVAIFFLLQKEDLRDRFIRLFGSSDLHRTTLALDDAGQRLSRYFLSQLGVNAGFGLVVGIGLWVIGIPSPAMWGVLSGLLRFVPYVGSILAAIAPAALGAAVEPGWSSTIYVLLLYAVAEPVTGYAVEPMLYGHSTGLSPVSVIVAAVFWTWVWGPIGLILSTPLTLCLVVTGRHVKSLEFFDVLLGDRPALTPVETFYQRILADDPDEALIQAEGLLESRPLLAYYDGVVLEGLKLAAADAARGRIDGAKAARIGRLMGTVIDDLSAHATGEPAAADAGTAVACVAGRGAFDDAVSAMLAQLLRARGLQPRIVPHTAVKREALAAGQADAALAGVGVIALSYLELNGNPASLRYLVRRLRERAPDARIVVGLWPQGEKALDDAQIQHLLGADAYVGSLEGAVAAISSGKPSA